MQDNTVLSLSFNTLSSSRLAQIATRVVNEFRNDPDLNHDNDDDVFHLYDDEESVPEHDLNEEMTQIDGEEEEREKNDFEFTFVCNEQEISPISADEIFYQGQIRPIFPIFGSDLRLRDGDGGKNSTDLNLRRFSLSNLMTEERDLHSCSSSEADELDNLPPETYCVWKPKRDEESTSSSPGKCKKSSSTGSSLKRWRFRDLLHRSNSDGKDTYVFMTPTSSLKPKQNEEKSGDVKSAGTSKATTRVVSNVSPPSAHEAHYARNRALKEGEKRRSYLPYRQDLVGFFVNVNGFNRKLHPF